MLYLTRTNGEEVVLVVGNGYYVRQRKAFMQVISEEVDPGTGRHGGFHTFSYDELSNTFMTRLMNSITMEEVNDLVPGSRKTTVQ